MDTMLIKDSKVTFINDILDGDHIEHGITTIEHLKGLFENESARKRLSPQTIIYEVDAYKPVRDGTLGGLFFGMTRIHPGQVGSEYFMTRGHFHTIGDRSEFYWGIKGEGVLIMMGKDKRIWAEKIKPGSLHYIPTNTAHRVANIGDEVLSFGACWPADAGHDYKEIERIGFSARLVNTDGVPQLKLENR